MSFFFYSFPTMTHLFKLSQNLSNYIFLCITKLYSHNFTYFTCILLELGGSGQSIALMVGKPQIQKQFPHNNLNDPEPPTMKQWLNSIEIWWSTFLFLPRFSVLKCVPFLWFSSVAKFVCFISIFLIDG